MSVLWKEQTPAALNIVIQRTYTGALELREISPEDTFVSVEVTTRFPEDRCKVHFMVYGLTPVQFGEIELIRHDIYRLRDQVRDQGLAHSVAHATYDMNGKLDHNKLEKLILIFDVFEGLNGSRSQHHNQIWVEALAHLTL